MNSMDLGLEGQTVTRHDFDYAMTLETDAGFHLSIENNDTPHPAVESRDFSPEPGDAAFDQPASFTNRTISTATSDQTGCLDISFTDGHHLTVKSDDTYEAWTLAAPDGSKVVCLPGGELATWQPNTVPPNRYRSKSPKKQRWLSWSSKK